jgi:hypothetical protein
MADYPSIFKTPELEAEYMAAYEAVLSLWPVPHEPLDVVTGFGTTHINAAGPKDAPPASTATRFWIQFHHVVSKRRRL